jgi:Tfp pilus assembly protein FimT
MIVGIVSSLTLASYNNFTETNKLEADANKLFDRLELSRKKSTAGDIPDTDTCLAFNGYGIVFDNSLTSYKLQLCCDSLCLDTNNQDLISVQLQTNNIFTIYSNIRFAPLTGQRHHPEDDYTDRTITIKNTIVNQCISISISYLGVIEKQAKTSC